MLERIDISFTVFTCFLDVDFCLGQNRTYKTFIGPNIFPLSVGIHSFAFFPLPKTPILSLFVHLGATVRHGVVHDLGVGAVRGQPGAEVDSVRDVSVVLAGDGAGRLLHPVRSALGDPDFLSEIADRA